MIIRIFADCTTNLERYLNFIRLEIDKKPWTIEHCDPIKWSPTQKSVADINLFVDIPVRVAIPWGKYNVFAINNLKHFPMFAWTEKEMDLIVSSHELCDRGTSLNLFRRIFRMKSKYSHPPMLPIKPETPPKVGIITVTRNRKKWWLNMVQNILKQNWPVSLFEWILVDDGDEDQRLVKEVEEFTARTPGIVVRYVEVLEPKTIGEKCNIAVQTAGDDVAVFMRMDDDDHYPASSITNRVAWLCRAIDTSKKQSQIVYCSTIPMYDIRRYISAINVPELSLPPNERISEATLTFTRSAWMERPFTNVSMAEGQDFLDGREDISVEIPSSDVIVSFIHSHNSSSRRVPADQPPNGCHFGLSDEFFKYLTDISA